MYKPFQYKDVETTSYVVGLTLNLLFSARTLILNTEYVEILKIIIPTIVGSITTIFVTARWQSKKDISIIRNQILNEFQSFKEELVLMETFIAKIILKNSVIDKKPTYNLRQLLPFGYNFYPEMSADDKIFTIDKIEDITFKFPSNPIESFKEEFDLFETEFINKRKMVTKFVSSVRQYYKEDHSLDKDFDSLWNDMMALHILIHKIYRTKIEQEFISLIHEINSSFETIFERTISYDKQLAKKEIDI